MTDEEEKVLPDLNRADADVAAGVDAALEPDDNFIRLSSGVILEARAASPNLLIRAMSRPRPEIPTYYNEKIGRVMENPDDPGYIKRVQSYEMEISATMLNVLIGTGTTLSACPEGIDGPDGNIWISDYAAMGLPTHTESPAWRYITWVLFIAAPKDTDTKSIMEKVGRLSGIREETAKAAQQFPGRK